MSSVTLIGKNLAKEGLTFIFNGCLSRCQNCELKNSCCGLEKNKWYEVKSVRDKNHKCKVHHGKVKVVEVEQVPFKTTASARSAIEGSMITLEKKDCGELECEHYDLCHPTGVEFDVKYNVKETGDKIDCKVGKDLKIAKLM